MLGRNQCAMVVAINAPAKVLRGWDALLSTEIVPKRGVLLPAREVVPGVFSFERVFPNGWCANMHVLKLADGGLFIHSPIWVDDSTFDAVEALGEPKVLFAPNHYHHLSLPKYVARYPNALAVTSSAAMPRLLQKGHATLKNRVTAPLPAGAKWIDCEGLKNGEVWLSLPGDVWLVSDAFMNVRRPVTSFVGFILKLWWVVPGLQLSRTWLWVGIGKRAVYRAWFLKLLEREKPKRLLVGHGDPVEQPDLPDALAELVRKRV